MADMDNLFAEDWEEPAETVAVDEELGQTDEDALAGEGDEIESGFEELEVEEALEAEELETEESLEEEPVEEEVGLDLTAVEERELAAEEEGEEGEVEASLDEILRVQFAREEEEPDVGEASPRRRAHHEEEAAVLPRRADEFVCRACFLVKSTHQLADPDHLLCRDCA